MLDNKTDLVPNMLNKKPTAMWGLTQAEIVNVVVKSCIFTTTIFVILGLCISKVAFITFFIGCGVISGCGIGFFICKNIIAPRKGDTPYGYYEHKAKLNSIWVKLGIVKLKTIHTTRLWRHFR